MPTAQISQVLELFNFTTLALLSLFAYRMLSKRYPLLKRLAESRQVFTFGLIIGVYFFAYAFFSLYSTFVSDMVAQEVPIISLRTVNPTDSGHYIALLVVFVFGFITWVHPKPNLVRMGILVLGLLGYHELLWNLAYLPTCVPAGIQAVQYFPCAWQEFIANSFQNTYVQATLTFSLYLIAGLLFYPREFKRSVRYLPFWVGFMALWVVAGFHITIDSRLNPAWSSPFFNDPDVDLVENLSWYIFGTSFLYAYFEVNPFRENWLYLSIQKVLNSHKDGYVRENIGESKINGQTAQPHPVSRHGRIGDADSHKVKPQMGCSTSASTVSRKGKVLCV